ncbi:MAG TPA: hypothetical protein VLM79_14875 [Kofleriaceae bacterium]|nr:hypothetical protein [Kofleriaceae bacterium]
MRCAVPLLGVALGIALEAGCQNGPPPPAPAPAAQPAPSAATPAASSAVPAGAARDPAGSDDGFVGESTRAPGPVPEAAHVTLPRTTSEPPNRTARPLPRKELARLAALEFPDFDRQERGLADRFVELRHTTRTRPILGVTVTIEPCDAPPSGKPARQTRTKRAAAPSHTCAPMELDAWKAKGDELKQFLSKQLAARPETRFEVGTRDVLGAPAIFTYQLGADFGKDESEQPVAAYSDAYILYYNDGVNQIRINASYLDDAVGGVERLAAIAPKEDLEKLAVAFMSVYLHEWR